MQRLLPDYHQTVLVRKFPDRTLRMPSLAAVRTVCREFRIVTNNLLSVFEVSIFHLPSIDFLERYRIRLTCPLRLALIVLLSANLMGHWETLQFSFEFY